MLSSIFIFYNRISSYSFLFIFAISYSFIQYSVSSYFLYPTPLYLKNKKYEGSMGNIEANKNLEILYHKYFTSLYI